LCINLLSAGIIPFYIFMTVIWGLGLFVHFYTHAKQGIDSIVMKLFNASSIVMALSFLFFTIHWTTFAKDGVGLPGLMLFAQSKLNKNFLKVTV
jgi:hypothetical protein